MTSEMLKRTAVIALLVLMTGSLGLGKEMAGVSLPDSLPAGNTNLILNGAGFRTKWFVKVYAGGLYLARKIEDPGKIMNADAPMALRLHIVYDGVTGKKMTDAMNDGFSNATGGNTLPIKNEISRFNAFFREDIKKGDIFDIVYLPKQGVSVRKNGKALGTIKGYAFKKALFGVWLCEKPADKKLKKAMLGR